MVKYILSIFGISVILFGALTYIFDEKDDIIEDAWSEYSFLE